MPTTAWALGRGATDSTALTPVEWVLCVIPRKPAQQALIADHGRTPNSRIARCAGSIDVCISNGQAIQALALQIRASVVSPTVIGNAGHNRVLVRVAIDGLTGFLIQSRSRRGLRTYVDRNHRKSLFLVARGAVFRSNQQAVTP